MVTDPEKSTTCSVHRRGLEADSEAAIKHVVSERGDLAHTDQRVNVIAVYKIVDSRSCPYLQTWITTECTRSRPIHGTRDGIGNDVTGGYIFTVRAPRRHGCNVVHLWLPADVVFRLVPGRCVGQVFEVQEVCLEQIGEEGKRLFVRVVDREAALASGVYWVIGA